MRKTSVSLGLSLIFLLLIINRAFGQDIKLTEKIIVDQASELKATPMSFCVTEDKLFLLPDYQTGSIKVFNNEGNFLKFIKELGPRFGKKGFMQPTYCFYSQNEGKLGVLDNKARKVFILDRQGKIGFSLFKEIVGKGYGYDIEFAGGGEQVVISGYLIDKQSLPFDLYSINIKNGQTNYLLPSHEKYNLESYDEYVLEYRQKQTLPAIGIKAFIDIQGDDLFFVWEGALRIIKLDLVSKKQVVFGHATPHYTKPDGSRLSDSYKKRKVETTWKKRKKMTYVRNIFATSRHVFLVYEMGKNNKSNTSKFRMQTYTLEGDFLGDVLFPGNPGRQMWFDKEKYELYAFSEQPGNDNGEFSILKYKIKR
ncbi:MAG: hypothetical protein JSV88_00045 [Candidatus Aminicenantes bacterium]|nr:MAG: hypothetical protein JSV88_00045 [Candidatus Aminicenantes bacterium]